MEAPMLESIAERLAADEAPRNGLRQPIRPANMLSTHELTEQEAYEAQKRLIAKQVDAGETRIGYKIAATSESAQSMLGLQGPAYGPLFEAYRIEDGATVSLDGFLTPRLECEIAFLMGKDVEGPGVREPAVLAACEAIVAAFEIVDLRTGPETGALGRSEVILYNALGAGVVLGDERLNPNTINLPRLSVTLKRNGSEVASGDASAVLGDPAIAMSWLANKLAANGESLKAGDWVISGTITPPEPVKAGDSFEADFGELGTLSISFS